MNGKGMNEMKAKGFPDELLKICPLFLYIYKRYLTNKVTQE